MYYDRRTTFSFSHKSGFYDNDFYLNIYAEVFYTLDGSVPSENSAKYTDPIHIIDASDNPNVYSAISVDNLSTNEVVYGCENQFVCKPAVPEEKVDNCTIVRAVCKYSDGTFSDEIISIFFVGFGKKTCYDNMMIASLISDPDGLFGYENGINVRGAAFDTDDFDSTEWALLIATTYLPVRNTMVMTFSDMISGETVMLMGNGVPYYMTE